MFSSGICFGASKGTGHPLLSPAPSGFVCRERLLNPTVPKRELLTLDQNDKRNVIRFSDPEQMRRTLSSIDRVEETRWRLLSQLNGAYFR